VASNRQLLSHFYSSHTGTVKVVLRFGTEINLYSYFPQCLIDLGETGTTSLNIIVFNIFQFYTNRRTEGHSFIMSLNEMKFIVLSSKDLTILAQIKLGKVCKLRQRVHRLRSLV